MQFGHILKCFYELYDSQEYNNAFLYSFGFNGYTDALEGLVDNIQKKNIQFAKFKKAKTTKKTSAKFVKSYYPTLINANPICNTININKNIIVTGPNASGKTTILKSSLINIIISQQIGCGFYSSASLTPYNHIHCYLNIPDTSGRDSLFQAEARRCKEIIDEVEKQKRTLCIFDELFSGTNPQEATASACSLLLFLNKFPSFRFLLTTHFIDVCKELSDTTIAMKHMQTVGETYTYKLENGISYARGGVKVLQQLKFPESIVNDARMRSK
jgi:DNA mismatch repair ATPase MutS